MATISRPSLVLLLVGLSDKGIPNDSIAGITRLQKFLFLLEKECGLTPTKDGFEFQAYKAGPYSSKLYDDLELLENLDFLESEVEGDASEAEAAEVDLLDFDQLMDSADEEEAKSADAYEERKFKLSKSGKDRINQLLTEDAYKPLADGIRKIKSKYGHHSLNDLLYYVYTKYPDMTTESEIRDQVLSRRRRTS
jgi:uncharacterized protein YwgA